jgi:hypothetical protein
MRDLQRCQSTCPGLLWTCLEVVPEASDRPEAAPGPLSAGSEAQARQARGSRPVTRQDKSISRVPADP